MANSDDTKNTKELVARIKNQIFPTLIEKDQQEIWPLWEQSFSAIRESVLACLAAPYIISNINSTAVYERELRGDIPGEEMERDLDEDLHILYRCHSIGYDKYHVFIGGFERDGFMGSVPVNFYFPRNAAVSVYSDRQELIIRQERSQPPLEEVLAESLSIPESCNSISPHDLTHYRSYTPSLPYLDSFNWYVIMDCPAAFYVESVQLFPFGDAFWIENSPQPWRWWNITNKIQGEWLEEQMVLNKLLRLRYDDIENLVDDAARSGGYPLIEWALEEGVELDSITMGCAVSRNDREMINFLRKKGCPFSTANIGSAFEVGYPELARWLFEQGCPLDREFELTADQLAFLKK